MQPNKYQSKIYKTAETEDCDLLIEAGPGSGKTTCLIQISKLLPKNQSMLFLAFNKSIVNELNERLPDEVDCFTFHSLGMKMLRNYYRQKLKVNQYKNLNYIKEYYDNNKDDMDKWFVVNDILNFGRIELIDFRDFEQIEAICEKYDLLASNVEKTNAQLIFKQLQRYNKPKQREDREIDFVDMIYLPLVLKNFEWFKYDNLLIDECFPYDQKIVTDKGKIKIGKLYNIYSKGEELPLIKSWSKEKNIFEWKRITKAWSNGKKDLVELKLGNKRKIRCTSNHRFLTMDGWKEVSKLNINDIALSSTKEQPYQEILTNDKLDLFLASILGDGSISKISNNTYRMKFIHGQKQKDYLYWKANAFNIENIEYIEKNGFSNKPAFRCSTKGFLIKENEIKPESVVNNINEKILAILWMDDGSFSDETKSGTLCTCVEDYKLITNLSNKIYENWNIENFVREAYSSYSGKKYYYIGFNVKGCEKLMSVISKYIHPNLEYKVLEKYKDNIGKYIWNFNNDYFGGMQITSISYLNKQENVYDLTVEDNHNYLITGSSGSKSLNVDYEGFIVHNCQDLSKAQHEFFKNLIGKRFFSVGDFRQAIYGFAGASSDSFFELRNFKNILSLPLSICYRCGTEIVKNAQRVYPDIEYFEGNPPGEVREGEISEIEEGDMVICRNVKPLISLYFYLITLGKKSNIKGKDLEKNLIRLLKPHKNLDCESGIAKLKEQLGELEEQLIDKGVQEPKEHHKYQSFKEKINVVETIAKNFYYIYGVIEKIEEIFHEDKKAIQLMTIHKAKGLESDRVFYLQRYNGLDLVPSPFAKTEEQKIQEKNLEFVALTRAKNELIYLSYNDE